MQPRDPDAAPELGLEVRAGLHTGEIELRGDDIGGISAHIGARVAALAGPHEVLVSRTVRDLVAGSGLSFTDRGEHELKGVPERWQIYAALRAPRHVLRSHETNPCRRPVVRAQRDPQRRRRAPGLIAPAYVCRTGTFQVPTFPAANWASGSRQETRS